MVIPNFVLYNMFLSHSKPKPCLGTHLSESRVSLVTNKMYFQAAEYSDGTPATSSQLAKDVATFLRWCSEPELDDRRLMTIKAIGIFSTLAAIVYYYKRHKWSSLKSRKLAYKPVSKK